METREGKQLESKAFRFKFQRQGVSGQLVQVRTQLWITVSHTGPETRTGV